jgi:acyl-coenzyme A synthetase/AMP-(fatty) acid ligase
LPPIWRRCRHKVRFVEEFPTTVTGKIRKFVMRQRMIDELGLKVEKDRND